MKIILLFILTIFSCDEKQNKEKLNNEDNEKNNVAQDCLEDSDCDFDDPQFNINPAGFTPVCHQHESGSFSCVECLSDEDCGENIKCIEETYCIGEND
jgi:hypothetical protein